MLRRAFMVSAASGSAQRHAAVSNASAPGQSHSESRGILRPREDLDIRRQRAMVDAEGRRRREEWLAAQVSPVTQSLAYHRHALRLLIINAAQRQQQQRGSAEMPDEAVEEAANGPSGATSYSEPQTRRPDTANPNPAAARGEGPPPQPFDLTRDSNLRHLLNDIDIVIGMAAQRNAETQQRMLSSTIDQIAKLDLWTA